MDPAGPPLSSEVVDPHEPAHLDLIPFGIIEPMISSVVAANIQAVVGLFVRTHPPSELPADAFITMRNQYDAAKIIHTIGQADGGAPFKLGLIAHDLCIPILTYVYGESQMGGSAAVISTARLFDTRQEIFYQRIAKVAVHETGHLVGLAHCRQIDCLMRFSRDIEQLDRLPLLFCSVCEYEIARQIKRFINMGTAGK